jgi:dTDP-4-amino-4,6-dideoxygalactose transaminase
MLPNDLHQVIDVYKYSRKYTESDKIAINQYLSSDAPNSSHLNNNPLDNLNLEYCKHFGGGYALSFNSGTNALLAAYFACVYDEMPEAIVQASTFFASATPLTQLGAKIHVVDSCPLTGNLRLKDIKKLCNRKISIITVTHMWSQNEEIEEIRKYCDLNNITLIEDASLAIGGVIHGKKIGSFGHLSVVSAGTTKLLSGGQGGLLWTENKDHYIRASIIHKFRGYSKVNTIDSLQSTGIGFNCQMHILSAIVTLSRLKKIDELYKIRLNTVQRFRKLLQEYGVIDENYYGCNQACVFKFSNKHTRNKVIELFKLYQIVFTIKPSYEHLGEYRLFSDEYNYISNNVFPSLNYNVSSKSFSNAETYFSNLLFLPIDLPKSILDSSLKTMEEALEALNHYGKN